MTQQTTTIAPDQLRDLATDALRAIGVNDDDIDRIRPPYGKIRRGHIKFTICSTHVRAGLCPSARPFPHPKVKGAVISKPKARQSLTITIAHVDNTVPLICRRAGNVHIEMQPVV